MTLEQAKRDHRKQIASRAPRADPALIEQNLAGFEAGWLAALAAVKAPEGCRFLDGYFTQQYAAGVRP